MKKFVNRHKTAGSFRRVDIVQFLAKKERSVAEVAQHERFSQPAASYQLLKLHREGFTSSRREGRNTYYRLSREFRSSKLFVQMMNAK